MDTTIIEHLACLEMNTLILQPPFHLLSNINWNDKGLSFDGDIEVYSNNIKKTDFIGRAPVQIKGTTTYKKQHKKNKIKHSVDKKDLDVYYKDGKGVLYFVVTINPDSYAKQAYYRILAPLDLKGLLDKLEATGNNSITIPFKRLENGHLERICKTFIKIVERQPVKYIEGSKKQKFITYKINYADVSGESFDLFEEPAYVYGVSGDFEVPIETAIMQEIRKATNEVVTMNHKEINVNYELRETEEKITLIIENTLTYEFYKKRKTGNINLGRVRTLESYVKCLKLVKYQHEHNKLPFKSFDFIAKINEKELFKDVDKDIKLFEELIEVCNQIGISDNYVFNEQEDLPSLFNGIIDIFKHKKFELINIHDNKKLENAMICNIELSNFVTVKVMFVENEFIDFFSKEALSRIGGLIPKNPTIISNAEQLPDNWEEYYWKVSIYSTQTINEMQESANFKFETLKLSFTEKYHDIDVDMTINIMLEYVNYFDESSDNKYLELALDIIQRYLEKFPQDDLGKINLYIIRYYQFLELSEREQDEILEILERAEKENNKNLCFACEVLLQNKPKAKRLFNSIDRENQNMIRDFPIFRLYEKLE